MFLITPDQKIIITKGDTASFNITITDKDNKPVPMYLGDSVVLTVKKNAASEEVISIEAEEGSINLLPSDTAELDAGVYVYDIKLLRNNGAVFTVVPINRFEITETVG